MKYLRIFLFISISTLFFSCKDDEQARIAETKRTQIMNDSILKVIDRNWKFNINAPTPKVAEKIGSWQQWQQFNNELTQKPTGSLDAFRRKAKVLSDKVEEINKEIPQPFDLPQVRSRMSVLITKVKQLYTFISLETIPDKKVIALIKDIEGDINAIEQQFNEIIRFSEIPKEEGEEEMIRALDTTRMANPDMMMPEPQNQATPTSLIHNKK